MTQLDDNFRAARARLRDQVVAQASAIWTAQHDDRNRYLAQVLTAVEGGQRAMATLTSAYLTAKAREVGQARHKALTLTDYTVEKLRGATGPSVYARPYGALYGQLNQGAEEATAQASALDALAKLAATDVHLAYTKSAKDWMAGDKRIAAFKRVPSGTCDYCEAAANGLYHPSVEMPIHENCECDLEPVFGKDGVAATGMDFHGADAGSVTGNSAGDLTSRLVTTGVPDAMALTEDQISALSAYANNAFENLNAALRGDGELSAYDAALADKLDSALASKEAFDWTADHSAYRAIHSDAAAIFGTDNPESLVGSVFKDDGFMSTSSEPFDMDQWVTNDSAAVKIIVPKGSPALRLNDVGGSHIKDEHEVLLPRGTELRITKASKDEFGVWEIEAEVVPGGHE